MGNESFTSNKKQIFLEVIKSIEEQLKDYVHSGARSPHSDQIESAQHMRIQFEALDKEGLRRLAEKLRKYVEQEDLAFEQEQLAKRKKEEEGQRESVEAELKSRKTLAEKEQEQAQAQIRAQIQQRILILNKNLKKINKALYKVRKFRERIKQARRDLIKYKLEPLLEDIKEKTKEQIKEKFLMEPEKFSEKEQEVAFGLVDEFLKGYGQGIKDNKPHTENFDNVWHNMHKMVEKYEAVNGIDIHGEYSKVTDITKDRLQKQIEIRKNDIIFIEEKSHALVEADERAEIRENFLERMEENLIQDRENAIGQLNSPHLEELTEEELSIDKEENDINLVEDLADDVSDNIDEMNASLMKEELLSAPEKPMQFNKEREEEKEEEKNSDVEPPPKYFSK